MLQTPVTSAPIDFAICTANVPIPPDAPLIRTVWPGWTLPWSRSAWQRDQSPATATAAACSNVRLAGFGAERVLGRGRVLGERAVAPAEDLVAGLEARHVRADRLDGAGDIGAADRVLRPAQAVDGRVRCTAARS